MNFIIKGLVRTYYSTPEGYGKNLNFLMENDTLEGYSFFNKNISLANVQCLEDCEIIQVPLELINHLIERDKYGYELAKFLAERYLSELTNLIFENDNHSVLKRYQ